MKISLNFVRYNLIGVKFFRFWICSKFVRFDSKIYDSIDPKGKDNSKNLIKINSKFVIFDSTPKFFKAKSIQYFLNT